MTIHLRPKSNLSSLTRPVTKNDLDGFLYIYKGKLREVGASAFTRMWATYVFPGSVKALKLGKISVSNARALSSQLAKSIPSGLLTLKKESEGFTTTVPVVRVKSEGNAPEALAMLLNRVFGPVGNIKEIEDTIKVENIPENIRGYLDNDTLNFALNVTPAYIDSMGFNSLVSTALKKTLRKVVFNRHNSTVFISLEFFIPKSTAEVMTSLDWVELRNVDLYPLLLDWVAHGFGQIKSPALQSLPITKIARNLPEGGLVRVNNEGLATGPDGDPYFLPAKLDDTLKYERLYDQAGSKEDGSFSLASIADVKPDGTIPLKLPTNVPVLIDWVNSKFAYTLSTGELTVMDLTRFRPANATHITSWLNRKIGVPLFTKFNSFASSVGLSWSKPPVNAEVKSYYSELVSDYPEAYARLARVENANTFVEYAACIADDYCYFNDIEVSDLKSASIPMMMLGQFSPIPAARPIGKFISDLFALTKERKENLYSQYSVAGTIQSISLLAVISHYADKYGEIHAEDRTLRSAALNQGIDPNYQQESIPLVSAQVGRMPHQMKIGNLMKDDPAFAVFPVQAGGGKCLTGENVVLTTDGLLTLKELRDRSGAHQKQEGSLPLKDVTIFSSWGKQQAGATYSRFGETVKVILSDGTAFEGLPEHRLWAYSYGKGFDYVRLDKLTKNHRIEKHLGTNVFGSKVELPRLKKSEFSKCAVTCFERDGYHLPKILTVELARILGYLTAEGWTPRKATGLKFFNADPEVLRDYIADCEAVFGKGICKKRKQPNSSVTEVTFRSVVVTTFLLSLLSRGSSSQKQVPLCIRESTKDIQLAFLSAFYEGDGTVYLRSNGKYERQKLYVLEGSTISRKLAYQLKAMFDNLGIPSVLIHGKIYYSSNGTKQTTARRPYNVRINYRHQHLFEDLVGFRSSKKKTLLSKAVLAAQDSLTNEINSNPTAQGIWSKKPFKQEFRALWAELNELVATYEHSIEIAPIEKVSCNGNEYVTKPYTMTVPLHVRGLWLDMGLTGYEVVHNLKTELNTYKLDLIKSFVDKMSTRQDSLGKEFKRTLLPKFQEFFAFASKSWLTVKTISPGRLRQVFDLTVPGPKDYIVNGVLSHNTWLGIEDILKQIKRNISFPYLVMCPDHLVAQYVSELNFFTEGRLNCIGIQSDVVKREGFQRIHDMIMAMPRNSVVVVAYDSCRLAGKPICYGTSRIQTYPVAEFLAQFNFGYVFCDESHYLKNDSKRSHAVMSVVANIPKRRLASGTFLMDSLADLALQVALLDPTIFGTQDDFKQTYGEDFRGDRVTKWKEDVGRDIMRKLKEHIVWAPARRREWAAWLPAPKFAVHRVRLSATQQQFYTRIFNETMTIIKEDDSANAKKLRKLLEKGKDDVAMTEEESREVEILIRPYLQRLEKFLTAPSQDEGVGSLLPQDEKVSPIPGKVATLIQEHISENIPGKILVFTSYHSSANEIYSLLPSHLKSRAILYSATTKIENKNQFENDPNALIMIGVENSMNTGLNLQAASRLIRVESVFNPGTLEQGQSRVLRPELKKKDTRENVYFDWIVADHTIAVTKMARLVSKLVSVTKFEEQDNPLYSDIPDVEVIPLDLSTIQEVNDFDTNLLEYLQAYAKLEQAVRRDYQEYRAEHPDLQPLTPVERAPDPEGVAVMKEVPYVNGMSLPFQDQFDLIRMDDYIRGLGADITDDEDSGASQDEDAEEIDPNPEADEEDSDTNTAVDYYSSQTIGKRVHTGYGEGEVLRLAMKMRRARILLDSGATVALPWVTVFLMEKPVPFGTSMREQLLAKTGLKVEVNEAAKANKVKVSKRAQKRVDIAIEKTILSVELQFSVSNGFLGIHYVGDESNEGAIRALQAAGFKRSPPLFFARIPTHRHLWKLFETWTEEGFKFSQLIDTADDHFAHLYAWMKSGRMAKRNAPFNFARKMDLIDFYRKELKPNSNAKLIKPYPIIEDGQVYVALPANGQVGSINAIRIKVPGVRWQKQEGAFIFHALNASAASSKIKELINSGIEITNIDELRKDFQKLKRIPIREVEINPLSISIAKILTLK